MFNFIHKVSITEGNVPGRFEALFSDYKTEQTWAFEYKGEAATIKSLEDTSGSLSLEFRHGNTFTRETYNKKSGEMTKFEGGSKEKPQTITSFKRPNHARDSGILSIAKRSMPDGIESQFLFQLQLGRMKED